ncbi:HNH endonuclease signature motif containing protein [Aeromicrobium yanjiei]|uniref:DUF222 domain-containing protein n=1 Tax=Aeromicrobium yanjiei TaxID=2662028 RepID=A0A5Q2MJA9_9ACTN|nr:HNH endonuclease signature motif containing protein [Aeromicrobium yanjiei]QGG41811.1 DUF222 domain-containing protein [Aeromicrobium yanjiei]
MFLDQLSSLSEDAAAIEPWSLTAAELREVATAVQRTRTGLDALASRLAGAAEAMGLPKEDGAASTSAWLADLTGVSKAEAGRLVGLARVTTSNTEATRAAWAAGTISTDQAGVIMRAIDALPDWCGDEERGDAEAHLIQLAGHHNLDDLKRLANRVLEVIDPDGADEVLGKQLAEQEKRAWDATRLAMRARGDGTTRGTFVIPDQFADTLRAAVEGIAAPRRNAENAVRHAMSIDDLTSLPHAQRLGLAFLELIEHMRKDALPQAGGLAATVTINVDLDKLRSGLGTATTSSGAEVSVATAQRIACNAHLVTLYLDSDSRVADLGMSKRLYDRYQRLALAARDRGCVWAGCDRPPSWCEAHHLTFWSEDGPTDLDNAALLCHFHHHLLHEGEWSARMAPDGVVEVVPPPRVDPEQVPRRHARFLRQQPRAA